MTKKKLLRIVLLVVVLVMVLDVGFGRCMSWYMTHKDIPGDYKKINYMLKGVDAQILFLGASVCMNSFKTEMLEKELGKSVFNGGLNDQRLEFFDVMCDAIWKHSSPELLILVLRQNDLIVHGNGRLKMMNIYYHLGNTKLDDYLNGGSLKQKILLNSALYRFNTYWWRILLYHFRSFDELAHGGFVGKPVPRILPQCMTKTLESEEIITINPHKLHCLENILATCRRTGTRLWIVSPPEYYRYDGESESVALSFIRDFCDQNSIPFFDDSQHPDFMDHPEYFYDNNHLNVNGAEIYTQFFLKRLKDEGI